MKRNEWTWEKSAAELAIAAEKQRDYHAERLEWWGDERAKAEAAINSAGLQVRSHPQTGGDRHEIVIDPALSQRLGECEGKMQGHRANRDDFDRWVQVLDSEPTRSFTLDHTDYIFFYGETAADE